MENLIYKNGRYLIFLFCLPLLFWTCAKDEEKSNDLIDGVWYVKNVSGGFTGVDYSFDDGVILWVFDYINGTLLVENNADSNVIYDGLTSGNYTFTILENQKNSFLIIDNSEFGGITLGQNEMVIDQNSMSTGSGADRFVIKLRK